MVKKQYTPLLKKVKNRKDAEAADAYLSTVEGRVSKELVSMLALYLEKDPSIIHKGHPMEISRTVMRSKNEFRLINPESPRDFVTLNAKTLDDFTLLPRDLFKAPGYDVLNELRHDIHEVRKDLQEEYFERSKCREAAGKAVSYARTLHPIARGISLFKHVKNQHVKQSFKDAVDYATSIEYREKGRNFLSYF